MVIRRSYFYNDNPMPEETVFILKDRPNLCSNCPSGTALASGFSTSGTALFAADQLPPWQVACGIPGRAGCGSVPSTAHSSIGDMWRWRRRMEQTCRRNVCPGIRRTSGRLTHKASPPPASICLPYYIAMPYCMVKLKMKSLQLI